MKRSFHILLIFLILLQSGGMFLFYQAQQAWVQHEMMNELTNRGTSFLFLKMTVSEFSSCRTGLHEISWHGSLYDVRSSAVHGKNVELQVIKDSRETDILKKARAFARNHGERDKSVPVRLVKLLVLSYISPCKDTGPAPEDKNCDYCIPYIKSAISWPIDISTPPPETV